MIIFSHLAIADFLYCLIIERGNLDFKLSKNHFKYGNIKPDIDKRFRQNKHEYNNCIHTVKEKLYIASDSEKSDSQRSLALGEATHYIADFFCAYHTREHFKDKDIIRHCIYEIVLHFRLKAAMFFSADLAYKIKDFTNDRAKGSEELITKKIAEYIAEKNVQKTDIIYSLSVTYGVAMHIFCGSEKYPEVNFSLEEGELSVA